MFRYSELNELNIQDGNIYKLFYECLNNLQNYKLIFLN
jgi:hypothetical protein